MSNSDRPVFIVPISVSDCLESWYEIGEVDGVHYIIPHIKRNFDDHLLPLGEILLNTYWITYRIRPYGELIMQDQMNGSLIIFLVFHNVVLYSNNWKNDSW